MLHILQQIAVHLNVVPHQDIVRQVAVLANHILVGHHIGNGMTSNKDKLDLGSIRLLIVVIIDMIHGLEEATHGHGRRTLLNENRLGKIPVLTKSIQNLHQIVPRDPWIGLCQMDLLLILQRIPSDAEHLVLVVLDFGHNVFHSNTMTRIDVLQKDTFALVNTGLLAGAKSRNIWMGRDGLPQNGGASPVGTTEQHDGFVGHDVAPLVGAVGKVKEAPIDKHLDAIPTIVQRQDEPNDTQKGSTWKDGEAFRSEVGLLPSNAYVVLDLWGSCGTAIILFVGGVALLIRMTIARCR